VRRELFYVALLINKKAALGDQHQQELGKNMLYS